MCICVLFWVCTTAIAMCYVRFFVVLHYCQRSMLCMFCLCCTTVSAGCYVLVCVHTTFQCRVLCMSCFVLHYCQRSVPCMSCLCYSTSSAVCYVCLVCVALLPAKCATVEHCKRSVPLLNTASAVCRCWTLQAQCAAVEHCQRSEPCGDYDKFSFHFYFHIFLLFLPILTSWEWMSTGVFNHNCQKSYLSCHSSWKKKVPSLTE